ncbi:MAG: hypothetical protein J0H44_04095 [Alphaproteobacteria bacterium]|nr:hypothetical protein [Alphaproteobacteria bacterium]
MLRQVLKRLRGGTSPPATATSDAKETGPATAAQKPDGTGAAVRLNSAGRLPINIWGDIMLDGSPPQVRRVLTGQDAHESLLSFFYLAEVLTLSEVVRALPAKQAAEDRPASVRERFDHLKSATADPHNQLTDEILQVFTPAALFFKLIGPVNSELCELGCTFFSAIEKAKICSSLLDAGADFGKVLCAAVDHSDYFLRGAMKLHEADNIVPYRDYADWRPSTPHPFHLSRFVASYAVASTDEFAHWLKTFSAFHIIDVVNLDASDFTTSNNGLRQIFFNFPKLVAGLVSAGWNVYLNEIAPDYNSGRRCAVVKMFGVRREIDDRLGVGQAVRTHTDLADLLPMEPLAEASARDALRRAETMLTHDEWRAFSKYKSHFPIWGRLPVDVQSLADVDRLTGAPKTNVDLHFESGQINYYTKIGLGEPT